MPKITLSKSTLLKEQQKLKSYKKFLPTLELKRQQLVIEKYREEGICRQLQMDYSASLTSSADNLIAPKELFDDICQNHLQGKLVVTEENLVGVQLPRFSDVLFKHIPYSLLAHDHWFDSLLEGAKKLIVLAKRVEVHQRRVDTLAIAVRKATQRVNLVSNVLIPESEASIRKIKIYLGDSERMSVVRSKIAKKKRLAVVDGVLGGVMSRHGGQA